MTNKILITGCARSGTKYMSELLTAHGLDIKHEEDGAHGTSDWRMVAKDDLTEYKTIIHLVRHPLNAISSIQTLNNESWGVIREAANIKRNTRYVFMCMAYWFSWNKRCEEITDNRLPIEALNSDPNLLTKFFGIEPIEEAFKSIPKNANTRSGDYKQLDWKHLNKASPGLCVKVVQMTIDYGYGVYL